MEVVITPVKKSVVINMKEKNIEAGASFTKQVIEGDYDALKNKPRIEDVELKGNKTFEDLGVFTLTNMEIENLLNL